MKMKIKIFKTVQLIACISIFYHVYKLNSTVSIEDLIKHNTGVLVGVVLLTGYVILEEIEKLKK